MTTPVVDDFLAHYGKKGMKWGVRKDLKALDPAGRADYVKSRDAAWVAKTEADGKIGKVNRLASRYANKDAKKLKQDYKDRGINIKKDSLARSRYDTELTSIIQRSVEKAAYKAYGISPTRLQEVHIHRHPDGSMTGQIGPRTNLKINKQLKGIARADQKRIKQEQKALKQSDSSNDVLAHAVDFEELFEGMPFVFVLDDEGFVESIGSPLGDDELAQSSGVSNFLAHYGVKGMKWGVRRKSGSSSSSGSSDKPSWAVDPPDRASVASGGKKSKASKPDASPDAVVFNALRQKAKEGGIQSLSNDEIRVLTARASAMDSYARTFPAKPAKKSKKRAVAEFVVQELLIETGKKRLKDITGDQSTNFAIKKGWMNPKKSAPTTGGTS